MTDLIPHVFEDNLVRSLMRDGSPWFIGRDICHVLDIKNESHALARLDDDERAEVAISDPSGSKTAIAVSEPGVFRLIFTSRKAEAERFKRWLAHDVLPALRRSGHYAMPGARDAGAAGVDPYGITAESITLVKTRLDLVAECRKLHGHERARALWQALGLPLAPVPPGEPQAEARETLAAILAMVDRATGNRVIDLVDIAMNEDGAAARASLRDKGIFVDPENDGIVIANQAAELEFLFEGTPRAHGRWRYALRRLPGARPDPVRCYHTYRARGTFIPSSFLDGAERNLN
jgi:prophage antirepressor-like protein